MLAVGLGFDDGVGEKTYVTDEEMLTIKDEAIKIVRTQPASPTVTGTQPT